MGFVTRAVSGPCLVGTLRVRSADLEDMKSRKPTRSEKIALRRHLPSLPRESLVASPLKNIGRWRGMSPCRTILIDSRRLSEDVCRKKRCAACSLPFGQSAPSTCTQQYPRTPERTYPKCGFAPAPPDYYPRDARHETRHADTRPYEPQHHPPTAYWDECSALLSTRSVCHFFWRVFDLKALQQGLARFFSHCTTSAMVGDRARFGGLDSRVRVNMIDIHG